ncbi:MAG: GDSL-type esterase/lipase family protein [Acidobacteriota bacterium]
MNRPHRREWIARAALVLTSLALGLGCVDLALRLAGVGEPSSFRLSDGARFTFFEYHPILGWDLVPGAVDRLTTPEFDVEIRIDGRGLRSHSAPSDDTAERWLVLGDSFTFGHGVEVEQGWPARLEAALRSAGRPVEVINLAVTGYGTDQQLMRLEERGPELGGDVVLLGLFVGNVFRNARSQQVGYAKPRLVDGPGGLDIVNLPLPRRRLAPEWPRGWRLRWLLSRRGGIALEHLGGGDAWGTTAAILRRFQAVAEGMGARPAVVVLPKDQSVYGGPPQRWLHRRSTELTCDLLAEVGLPFLDLTSALTGAADGAERLYFPVDGHWTAAGHGVAAEAAARWLEGEGSPVPPQ